MVGIMWRQSITRPAERQEALGYLDNHFDESYQILCSCRMFMITSSSPAPSPPSSGDALDFLILTTIFDIGTMGLWFLAAPAIIAIAIGNSIFMILVSAQSGDRALQAGAGILGTLGIISAFILKVTGAATPHGLVPFQLIFVYLAGWLVLLLMITILSRLIGQNRVPAASVTDG